MSGETSVTGWCNAREHFENKELPFFIFQSRGGGGNAISAKVTNNDNDNLWKAHRNNNILSSHMFRLLFQVQIRKDSLTVLKTVFFNQTTVLYVTSFSTKKAGKWNASHDCRKIKRLHNILGLHQHPSNPLSFGCFFSFQYFDGYDLIRRWNVPSKITPSMPILLTPSFDRAPPLAFIPFP